MIAAVIGVGLVVIYAVGSALWVQSASSWYTALRRPPWQPPDVAFGLIWPYNFIVLGIVLFNLARNGSRTQVTVGLSFFAVSVAASLAWSYLFYGPHQMVAAASALVIAAVLTLPVTAVIFQTSTMHGWLLVPYQLWIGIAASLSCGYAVLNR